MVRGRRLGGDAGVEDARADLSRDAGTVVGDPHLDSVLLRVSHQHLDAAAVPGGVDSVVHQVVDDRDQVVASAVTDFGVRVQPERDAALPGCGRLGDKCRGDRSVLDLA
jgi:hypothetical protein